MAYAAHVLELVAHTDDEGHREEPAVGTARTVEDALDTTLAVEQRLAGHDRHGCAADRDVRHGGLRPDRRWFAHRKHGRRGPHRLGCVATGRGPHGDGE